MINSDIELIFSKHHNHSNQRVNISFNRDTVERNKRDLDVFRENNLIITKKHFYLEEDDIIEGKTKEQKYFKQVLEDTLKHDNLYCSYLDEYKSSNQEEGFTCPGCFSTICKNATKLNQFKNVYTTQCTTNTFNDYFEIFDANKLKELITESERKDLTDKQMDNLLIDNSPDSKSKYVSVKCNDCLNLIGVYDSLYRKYILINPL
jgi:hypothetical protein